MKVVNLCKTQSHVTNEPVRCWIHSSRFLSSTCSSFASARTWRCQMKSVHLMSRSAVDRRAWDPTASHRRWGHRERWRVLRMMGRRRDSPSTSEFWNDLTLKSVRVNWRRRSLPFLQFHHLIRSRRQVVDFTHRVLKLVKISLESVRVYNAARRCRRQLRLRWLWRWRAACSDVVKALWWCCFGDTRRRCRWWTV